MTVSFPKQLLAGFGGTPFRHIDDLEACLARFWNVRLIHDAGFDRLLAQTSSHRDAVMAILNVVHLADLHQLDRWVC